MAAASGVLQVVIFPTPDLHWLCWIAFAPLLAAVLRPRAAGSPHASADTWRPASPLQAFLLGWLAGFIWAIGSCYWIFSVMNGYGGLGAPVALGVLVAFCVILGGHTAVYTWLLSLLANGARDPRAGLRRALVLAPVFWVAMEYFRTAFTSFPWNLLGTVQVNNISLTRVATATGVYGISFEILLVNAGFAAAWVTRQRARRVLLIASLVATVALQASEFIPAPALPAPGTALLVQPNLKLMQRWTAESFQQMLDRLHAISVPPPPAESLGDPLADLVVWPESPAPFFVNDEHFRNTISQIAMQSRAWVITGSIGVAGPGTGLQPENIFNSASLVAPNGVWTARYDKIHLVPFGEYVPYKSFFGFAHQLTREVGDFVPGTRRNVFNLGRYKVGAFICYESIFPGEVREFAAHGAQVFVNISDDEWFGHSAAPGQHLNQARMRAVENGRWLLRSTNTGLTVSIDPYGRVVERAPRDVLTALHAPFGVVTATTFYTRHGDWFCWLCVIISLVALAASAPWQSLRRQPSARI
jgi:apolipoprotein N-acyltransferase